MATPTANQREGRVPTPAPKQTIRPVAESFVPSPSTRTPVKQVAPKVTPKAVPKPEVIPPAGDGNQPPPPPPAAGKTVVRTVQNADGTTTIFYSDGTSETVGTPTKKAIVPNVAYDTIQKILESYRITGLASVLESIRDEYPEASGEELMTLLQFDSRYNAKFNERFAANVTRQAAGKPVLSPGEYLKLEQAYIKVFDSYNLPLFKTQAYYDSFIVGDTDATEVLDRVQLAYDRVLSDDPVSKAFTQFYPSLGAGDIVTGMLDTKNQLPALQQKVKSAEIGGAALRQGLNASELATLAKTTNEFTNVTTSTLGADVLARQGITKAQAEAGYQKIAQVLPTAEKLSSIYDSTTDQYGRLQAEEEQFQGLASAARKRQRLSDLETAAFKKSSGLGKSALGTAKYI
jgi:hypothetical protein